MNSSKRPKLPAPQNRSQLFPVPQSRRQFLEQAGLATGGLLGGLSIARGAHVGGSETFRIGLIGCGGRGAGAVVNALSVEPAAKLTAVSDAFPDRAQAALNQLKQRFGDRIAVEPDRCFSGFEGYKALLASGVDVALLAEPPHFRPMHLEACVEAGVHAFAEKPMAVDAPGVRRVLAAGEKARQKNLSFISGFETRYHPAARDAVARIHDGWIGDVLTIEGVYNIGYLWHRGRKPEWTEMEFQMRNWYYFTWLSGDHIVEQFVHFMDLVGWVMHEQPPVSAWGYGGRAVRTEPMYGDIFDHHAAVIEYATGTKVYGFTRQQENCWNDISYRIVGSKGKLIRGRGGWATFVIEGERPWQSQPSQKIDPEANCFREMFAAIRNGKPINDCLSMARSTMLAILCRMATHSGQLVRWEEAFESNLVLAPDRYAWDATPPVLPGPDGAYPHPIPGKTKVL